MTVIYSNHGDNDTLTLQRMWANLPNVRLIEITHDTEDYEDMVDEAIAQEEDTILFCGHGTTHGLLHPNFMEYILHENNYHLIRARNVIGIWCYASTFAETYHINGFFSSMYVSNIYEAYRNGLTEAKVTEVTVSLELFCDRVHDLLSTEVPLSEWHRLITRQLNECNSVEVFNYNGLRYYNNF